MSEKQLYVKKGNLFIFACFLMIAFMMASKLVYTASMVEILDVFQMTEDVFALGPAIYYVVYAIVQLLLSLFIFKMNMKAYLIISTGLSCAITCLLALSTGITYFCIVLGINGIAQAGIWAGCMYFLTKHLPTSMLPKANTLMTCGFPTGTIVSYGISSLCVALGKWWLSFIVAGVLFGAVLCFFVITLKALEKMPRYLADEIDEEVRAKKEGYSTVKINKGEDLVPLNRKSVKILYYALVGVVCFMVYNLYASVIEWIPKMLSDVYDMGNSLAILFAIVVPIGVIFGPIIIINLCEKFANYYMVSFIACLVMVAISALVYFVYGVNFILALVVLVAFALLSRAVCSVYETVIVAKMQKRINAGSFAAFTNATASFGAAASPLIMGNSVLKGWSFTYGFMLVECVLTAVLISMFLVFFVKTTKSK